MATFRSLQIALKILQNPGHLNVVRLLGCTKNTFVGYRGYTKYSKCFQHPLKRRFRAGCVGAFVASVTFFSVNLSNKLDIHNFVPIVNARDDSDSKRMKLNFIADVVEKAAPAVVQIERTIRARHVFTGQETAVPESNGSGFIVREDGLILTNAHVVGQKPEVKVKLHDGRSFTGIVQAVDRVSDLATVKIEASQLPTLQLGQSSTVRPGEWVVALGSPLQLSNTVTCGIVSTPHRSSGELGLHGRGISYIQTDAAIDRGNSGGPLVNLDGEAIGINTIKLTPGISFAIPSDYAQAFLDRAFKVEQRQSDTGWFSRSSKPAANVSPVPENESRRPHGYYIGVQMMTLTPEILHQLQSHQRGLEELPVSSTGVLVVGVIVNSPAYRAGLRPRDVIVKINGERLQSTGRLYTIVDTGKELQLEVKRSKETLHMKLSPEAAD